MYILGVLCLVAAAVALPVLPDPPTLPEYIVKVEEYKLHTNLPKIGEVAEVKGKEEEKHENKEEKEQIKDKVTVLEPIPSPPELPPIEFIFENIKKPENVAKETEDVPKEAEQSVSETENSESKEEEAKKENEVEIKVEDSKEKPMADAKPTIVKWKIPTPPFLNNLFSSLPSLPISIPYLSNIGWPFKLPIFRQPRIDYPGYIVLDQI